MASRSPRHLFTEMPAFLASSPMDTQSLPAQDRGKPSPCFSPISGTCVRTFFLTPYMTPRYTTQEGKGQPFLRYCHLHHLYPHKTFDWSFLQFDLLFRRLIDRLPAVCDGPNVLRREVCPLAEGIPEKLALQRRKLSRFGEASIAFVCTPGKPGVRQMLFRAGARTH